MLGDILRLVRAPLAVTAIADGVAGYLLARVRYARSATAGQPDLFLHEKTAEIAPVVLVAIASTALYWAGMALNDYFDLERDRKLYPFRPLPSGKIRPGAALALGLLLIIVGAGAAFLAGTQVFPHLHASTLGFPRLEDGRGPLIAALGTAAAILAYDAFLKRFRLPGALAMGACRTGNVLLGARVAIAQSVLGVEGVTNLHLAYALAIGLYVFSLTLLSTFEDEDAPASGLALGFLGVLAIPPALALILPDRGTAAPFLAAHFALGVVLAISAIQRGTKATGHTTTRWLIRGLLLLDAGAIAGSGFSPVYAVAVLALIVPGTLGARVLFAKPPSKPNVGT
jgi:4-hydroxybenzoate polyprenyltransferase